MGRADDSVRLRSGSCCLLRIGRGTGRPSTRSREAYFLDYAERVRRTTRLPLMLTGGLRTVRVMNEVAGGAVDVVGMARPMVVEPDLPAPLLAGEAASALDVMPRVGVRLFDDLLQIEWYQRQLRLIGRGRAPVPGLGRWSTLVIGFAHLCAFNPFGALRRGSALRLPEPPAA